MNTDWQTFLTQHPTQATNIIPTKPAIMPLSSWCILTVEGADATSLLQNLCTNDVTALADDQVQLNSLCNPKGRLLAIFWLLKRQSTYQLILPKSVCDSLLKRLKMYILRSEVTIEDSSSSIILLGSLSQNDQLEPLQGKQQDNGYALCLPGTRPRKLFLSEPEQAIILAQSSEWVEEETWHRIDIESGFPFIFNETIEQFTPQQINLDLLNGVSFSKGCYPGQEIVARLHYLGSPSRRLFSASVITDSLPLVGSEIIAEDTTAGHIVQAEYSGSTVQLLISLKLINSDHVLSLPDSTVLTSVTALASE